MVKSFFIGAVLGAAVSGTLAYNAGRHAPLLANPFEPRDAATVVKETARHIGADVKDGVRELMQSK